MYAELVCRSNYSFLTGASHPEELVEQAAHLGLAALALTDDDGLYGAVKAHQHSQALGLKFLVASQLKLDELPVPGGRPVRVALYALDGAGYANLSQLISTSRLAHPKGEAGLSWRAVAEHAAGLVAVLPFPLAGEQVAPLAEAFPGRFYVGLHRSLSAGDEAQALEAQALARALGLPVVAHNDVHTHLPQRQPLQDVMTCIRHRTTLAQAGTRLFPNAERHLKSPVQMRQLFSDCPQAVERTLEIALRCQFTLSQLRYEFSKEDLPDGLTPQGYLVQLVEQGLRSRYPAGPTAAVRAQVDKELHLIEALDFAGYFLSLWDIVRFARERGILCQGRGSAANSAVCYALQLTSIDPVRMGLLFERFLSMERREPPDIDIDFEHERREEVLQYVYGKHGRHRAAMVCEHICFRQKLATREVGKALGLSLDQVDRLARALDMPSDEGLGEYQLRQAGLSKSELAVQHTLTLSRELQGMPRHLSIHVGGFVITHGDLTAVAPIENASMKDRTVVQWEKDDLSALDILKVDLLGLGMLTVLSRCFALLQQVEGLPLSMATVPAEDPGVYDMICEADTIGTFQIESRAQQNMLPRLRPRCFYDLVIEIAIIRPGPIVGDMVHPFLRRRNGQEPVTYPSPEVKSILERTLGIPLFQEQAMRLAMVAGGFSAGEADALRRALSNKRALELLPKFKDRFLTGALSRGYPRAFVEACFEQFKGFAHYGFPESHSASFALIAYVSCWLKRYHPAAFCAALLDSQPMGFYAPHTLVSDAERHGVQARAIDVNHSGWHCRLELEGPVPRRLTPVPGEAELLGALRTDPSGDACGADVFRGRDPRESSNPALRLGLELVKGLRQDSAQRVEAARAKGPFTSVGDLARRSRIPRHELTRLALAGALGSICSSRREALWQLAALGPFEEDDLFFGLPMNGEDAALPAMGRTERVLTDLSTVGLSLESHPVALLRPELDGLRALTAASLQQAKSGALVGLGGLVIVRQRPPTARGFTFMSVEDETGIANFVIEPRLFEQYRREITHSPLIFGEGEVERSGRVVNLKVRALRRLGIPDEPEPQGRC